MISAMSELKAARSLILDAAHGSLMAFTDFEALDTSQKYHLRRRLGTKTYPALDFKPSIP